MFWIYLRSMRLFNDLAFTDRIISIPLYEYIEIQDIVGNSCRSVILVYDRNHYDNGYRVWSPVIIAT